MMNDIDGSLPTRIEVDLGNLCNMRCRTCNGDNSSRWAADEIAMGMRPASECEPRHTDWELSVREASELREIRFKEGGEPLLRQDDIVRNILRSDNLSGLTIEITTNGMVPIGQGLLDIICLSERAFIKFSVDGYGDLNDYIRSDGSWKTLRRSLMHIDDIASRHPNVGYGIVSVLSVLNCNMLHELWQWYESCLYHADRKASMVPLRSPGFYDARNLPGVFKSRLNTMLVAEKDKAHRMTSVLLDQLMEHINLDAGMPFDTFRSEFNRFNGYLDESRGVRLCDVNPELAELLG